MASVTVNPQSIRAFASEAAFEAWLKKNHDKAEEVWVKIFKKSSGTPSIDASQGIDVALCWGWIDGIRKSLDEVAFLQRYTPRTPKSRWSQINRDRVARLRKAGRMTPHGQRQVDAAKADGRWDAAYASPKAMKVPEDFMAALREKPRALRTFEALSKPYLFSIGYRLFHIKTATRRAEKIADMVARLGKGELPFATPLRPGDVAPKPSR
jgi:uncharacterized protein YdeI (YjbR/CyaY-like superfamily)